jgi:hypothetical protein
MRSGTYDPGESVSFGSGSHGSDIANTTTSYEADAKDFATFVGKTRDEYRSRENKWQTAGTCATLTANPVKNTITVHPGDTDKFSAQVVAVNGGGTASKARWTLSGPVNATFSPISSNDAQPSFSYTVTSQPSGSIMSVLVHATSTAGVAEDTWYQPLEKPLNTITGTFTGHATDAGVIYNWTGTATFKRVDAGTPIPGPGGLFQLVSGQATVAVSGSEIGSGCDQTGTSTIGLFAQSPWSVGGNDSPFTYSIVAPFNPDPPQATNVDCSNPQQNGTPAGLGSMAPAALQSGDTGSLQQTTNDLYTYSGSANAPGPDPETITTWSWSFTGQP